MTRRNLAIGLALLTACYLTQFTIATATRKNEPTKFTVRVENISNPEGMTASNGEKFPFALSPGVFVLTEKKTALFTEGKPARNGLEMQAEDGDPSGLVASLVAMHHSSNLHGVFNTPVKAMAAGPIRPGDSYEFTVTAAPGMRLFMTQMFGQSNDWFYAPGAKGIALFDAKGVPVSGDITDQFYLWDAGTEKDEEIGIGPNQGPRQKGPNTGEAENGVVHRVKDDRWTGKNAEFFRITISPEGGNLMALERLDGTFAAGANISIAKLSKMTPANGPPVIFYDAKQVTTSFSTGAVLLDGRDRNYMVHTSRRDKPGVAEIHSLDTDIIYVLQGSATFVTGGTAVEAKEIAPDEIRGSRIEGGVTRQLSKGEVIIVPNNTPHWFKEVNGEFLYYTIKVR